MKHRRLRAITLQGAISILINDIDSTIFFPHFGCTNINFAELYSNFGGKLHLCCLQKFYTIGSEF